METAVNHKQCDWWRLHPTIVGQPYTINAYRQNHACAVKRVDLYDCKKTLELHLADINTPMGDNSRKVQIDLLTRSHARFTRIATNVREYV